MECKFVVGQRVVCILEGGMWMKMDTGNIEAYGPKYKEICIIEKIQDCGTGILLKSGKTIYLIGLQLRGYDGLFQYDNFRPLNERPKETSIEVFKKLLTPVRVKEKA